MFSREAEGLNALDVAGAPRVPRPYLQGDTYLLLEDLNPGPPSSGFWNAFGEQLAVLHSQTGPRFGFAHDNFIGSTPQPNTWMEDGFAFFGEHRLAFQARLAQDRGFLTGADLKRVDRLIARLPELIPLQPASLVHGDLWSGNAITDDQGRPALIDPAAHFGWAEAELAMTALFGGFPGDFYRAYEAAARPQPGYRERFPVYNLYHLLNHLNLFGYSYLGRVQAILSRFG
jgi:fructosamine-3-kinase